MWLLSPEKASEIRAAVAKGSVPTARDSAEYCAAQTTAELETVAATNLPRNMSVAGSTAEIRVEGILTEKPDLMAWLFGGGNTTYAQIQASLAVSGADASIRDVVLDVNSPGGTVAGLFETLATLEAFQKPIRVRASRADSAAYAIAAVAGPIEAKTHASEFGSIGVAASFFVDDELVDITSTEAPNKRPDVSTDEGKAVVREQLDAIHDLFVGAIADGRTRWGKAPVTSKAVNESFGRGSVLLAREAHARGMVDKIPPKKRAGNGASAMVADADPIDAPASSGAEENMDIQVLKAQHRELYEAVQQEGVEAGVKQERDRVLAHLTFGEKCGAMDIATKAIRDGSGLTLTLNAEYMTAGRNKVDVDARQQESQAASDALAGAQPEPQAMDLGDQVVALLKKERGQK
jgi:ClpP class serine protease